MQGSVPTERQRHKLRPLSPVTATFEEKASSGGTVSNPAPSVSQPPYPTGPHRLTALANDQLHIKGREGRDGPVRTYPLHNKTRGAQAVR